MDEIYKEEQRWLKSVQKKLKKYISHWKWDCIILTTTQYEIIAQINSVTDVKDLPMLVNERLVDYIIEQIEAKFKQVKQASNTNDF